MHNPVDVGMPRHAKTARLARLLDVAVPHAAGYLLSLWCEAQRWAPDGDLTGLGAAEIASWAQWPGDPERLLAALEAAGWLDRAAGEDGGESLTLHEWEQYGGAGAAAARQRARPRSDPHPHLTRYREKKEARAEQLALVPAAAAAPAPAAPLDRPRAARGEGKNAKVIDLLREGGADPHPTAADHAAIKHTTLTPREIAEVYLAIWHGAFGDDWMRSNLSVQLAIRKYDGYQASKRAPRRPNANGRIAPAMAAALWHPAERSTW